MTQPLGHNYGGIIQNFALQKVLKDNGYQPITINRRSGKDVGKFVSLKIELNHKLKNISGIPLDSIFIKQKVFQHTRSFIKKYISITEALDSNEILNQYFQTHTFDAYIVGSDQTWRPKYSPNIYNFYLDFLKKGKAKRISYASSFGTDQWEYTDEEQRKCVALAQQFDAVSVREDSAVVLCKNFLNVDASLVLDPTLLLGAEDYFEVINAPIESKHLFTYVLDKSQDKNLFIKKCSTILQMEVSGNQARYNLYDNDSNNVEDYQLPPLESWLQSFRDAEFVITDSFHGTIFSILNNKPFIAIVNRERGSSRFISLLTQLGLMDRLVYDVRNFDTNLLFKSIDYIKVQKKLNILKQSSLQFLLNALKS